MFLKLSKLLVFASILVLSVPQKNYTVGLSFSIAFGGMMCVALSPLLQDQVHRGRAGAGGLSIMAVGLVRVLYEGDQQSKQNKKEDAERFLKLDQQQQQMMAALERLEQKKA